MKLYCNVEVSNKSLSVTNLQEKQHRERSCLAIGWVDGNIEKIFTKFITEGKATIRLTVPPIKYSILLCVCVCVYVEGFPKITKELHVMELNRKSFDRQILILQSLTILNLSDNLISSLLKELDNLPCLQELYLAHNQLGKTIK
ncbi:uncharacterized protein [Prorops nasuta]|uniref:uncharacterized protein n=1 Tax=Prorops nasuta TaxID=863751 RepID=UPI0034D00A5E